MNKTIFMPMLFDFGDDNKTLTYENQAVKYFDVKYLYYYQQDGDVHIKVAEGSCSPSLLKYSENSDHDIICPMTIKEYNQLMQVLFDNDVVWLSKVGCTNRSHDEHYMKLYHKINDNTPFSVIGKK